MKKILVFVLFVSVLFPLSCSKDTQKDTTEEVNTEIESTEQNIEKDKNIDALKGYMEEEINVKPEMVEYYETSFKNHPDIRAEFEKWIATREYETENPIVVEGYTAKDISELAPFEPGIGVYTFMISLREEPEYAIAYIKKNYSKEKE